jgi:chloramphenicol-sensitive protein RarD
MSGHSSPEAAKGVGYGLLAYVIWGCFPLFFSLFKGVPAWEVLIHRVLWSCMFLVLLVSALGRWAPIRAALARPSELGQVLACALLIGANWGIFIYAVETRQVFQASLGYFLTPLVNVALGMVVLHERMTGLQRWAVALAGLAIAMQLLLAGELPWITLLLALTFGTYGLLRKQVALDGLSGLFVETLVLFPVGLVAIAWLQHSGHSHFLIDFQTSALLMVSGVVTTVPLMLFAGAARRLRLATLGFLMYINPTMQFVTAWLVFREPLTSVQLTTFAMIWTGLAMYSWSTLMQSRVAAVTES